MMQTQAEGPGGTGACAGADAPSSGEFPAGVRVLVLNLPEDEGEGLGFRLTRTLWDPYPWVREVSPGGAAAAAGLRPGDCLLEASGKDLLGLPVGSVARLIRGDGAGRDVTLLAWHCGRDPTTDPELLWSCGGGLAGERSRRALEGVLRALSCCVCTATATAPRRCRRDHLYCAACWSRLERCALCREGLPAKDSPHARNLVAEQVFEAIATEYEIKTVQKRSESSSAYTSPNRSPNMSPNMSPSVYRRGQYQLSLMRKKQVQFNEKNRNYASDPNLHRSSEKGPTFTLKVADSAESLVKSVEKNTTQNLAPGNSKCNCQVVQEKITCKCNASETDHCGNSDIRKCECHCQNKTSDRNVQTQTVPVINVIDSDSSTRIPHRLVAQLRAACSMHELPTGAAQPCSANALPTAAVQPCSLSKSLGDLHDHCKAHGSAENIRNNTSCEPGVFLVAAPPIYVVTCGHTQTQPAGARECPAV